MNKTIRMIVLVVAAVALAGAAFAVTDHDSGYPPVACAGDDYDCINNEPYAGFATITSNDPACPAGWLVFCPTMPFFTFYATQTGNGCGGGICAN